MGTISDNAVITIVGVTNKASVDASSGIAGGIVGGYSRIVSAKKIEIYNVANFGDITASVGIWKVVQTMLLVELRLTRVLKK